MPRATESTGRCLSGRGYTTVRPNETLPLVHRNISTVAAGKHHEQPGRAQLEPSTMSGQPNETLQPTVATSGGGELEGLVLATAAECWRSADQCAGLTRQCFLRHASVRRPCQKRCNCCKTSRTCVPAQSASTRSSQSHTPVVASAMNEFRLGLHSGGMFSGLSEVRRSAHD